MTAGNDEARTGREYPRAPIVGVAAVVVRGDELLLIRRGREPMLGAWSLPGGALELGETTAEGIVREIFEETGVRARPLRSSPLSTASCAMKLARRGFTMCSWNGSVQPKSRASWFAAMMLWRRGGSPAMKFFLPAMISARLH